MEYLVYVLFSQKHQKTYRGMTSNLIARFKSQNELGTKGWTIKFRPWKVVHVEEFHFKSEALKREKFLKSGQGRKWIARNLILKQ